MTQKRGPSMRFNKARPAPGFGRRLRELRDLRGMSQDALAAKLGIGRNQVSDYERGRRRPNHGAVAAMDRLLRAKGSLLAQASLATRLWAAEREIERLTKLLDLKFAAPSSGSPAAANELAPPAGATIQGEVTNG